MEFRSYPPVFTSLPARALGYATVVALSETEASGHANTAASEQLAVRYPGRSVLLTDSGTSALQLTLALSGAKVGAADHNGCGLVALPAYCCPDVASAAIGAGAAIVLYDVDPHSLAPDWDSVQRCLDRGATCVVATHLFGRLVDMPRLIGLATSAGTTVIEDAAQGAGGVWNDVPAGALAPWSIISFGRGKGINAAGGGAVLYHGQPGTLTDAFAGVRSPTRGVALRQAIVALASQLLAQPTLYTLPSSLPWIGLGETVYRPPQPVRRASRTTEALLPIALRAAEAALPIRQRMETWYWEQLESLPDILLNRPPAASRSGALRFPVMLKPDVARPLRYLGVARSYPRTLAEYPEIAGHVVNRAEAFPGAAELAARLHTLPTHDLLPESARNALVRALRDGSR